MRATPVRFRYGDLNEAARVCGCAVYVISIAREVGCGRPRSFRKGLGRVEVAVEVRSYAESISE
jgi:hypothetical protein